MPLITINQVQKYYGNNHVLKGVDLDIDMGGDLHHRAQRIGQKHAPALHQRHGRLSGRQHQAGRHDHYRPGFPGARNQPLGRDGVSELQPVPAHDGAGKRDARPASGAEEKRRRMPRIGPAHAGERGLAIVWITTRRASPAASSSAWRLPARWRCRRKCYSATRSPPRSTRSWWAKCSRCWSSWRPRDDAHTGYP